VIRFQDVRKTFGATRAVDGVTLTIGPGEVVALLGPNGSGKTTTLKMAAGLVKPDAGRVTLGEPPVDAGDPRARRALSFLPQRVAFPEALTGREVVDFYRRLRALNPDRATAVLRFASLNGAGKRPVATYSGGMVQRLGLAVAMLPDAETLLLDEPTAALDPQGLQAFYSLVCERRSPRQSVLFTSHQVADVERLADRIVIMAAGRLAGEYTRDALRTWRDAHGVMRVRLDGDPGRILSAVQRLAPRAAVEGGEVIVPGGAAERAAVLDAIRESGGVITGLVAEDGRLDALYAELVGSGGTHA
jgi:Cu-processing system ATP-binding protein